MSLLTGLVWLAWAAAAPAQAPKADTVPIVASVGCLREATPGVWTLEQASDPTASTAVAPSPKELAALPRVGTRRFQLIGVTEFNLPAHRGHLVAIKGLEIKANPVNRLNVTSVTMVAPTCEAKTP
jgi:hypothetical protein